MFSISNVSLIILFPLAAGKYCAPLSSALDLYVILRVFVVSVSPTLTFTGSSAFCVVVLLLSEALSELTDALSLPLPMAKRENMSITAIIPVTKCQ